MWDRILLRRPAFGFLPSKLEITLCRSIRLSACRSPWQRRPVTVTLELMAVFHERWFRKRSSGSSISVRNDCWYVAAQPTGSTASVTGEPLPLQPHVMRRSNRRTPSVRYIQIGRALPPYVKPCDSKIGGNGCPTCGGGMQARGWLDTASIQCLQVCTSRHPNGLHSFQRTGH